MTRRAISALTAVFACLLLALPVIVEAQKLATDRKSAWVPPKTPWGDPDILHGGHSQG